MKKYLLTFIISSSVTFSWMLWGMFMALFIVGDSGTGNEVIRKILLFFIFFGHILPSILIALFSRKALKIRFFPALIVAILPSILLSWWLVHGQIQDYFTIKSLPQNTQFQFDDHRFRLTEDENSFIFEFEFTAKFNRKITTNVFRQTFKFLVDGLTNDSGHFISDKCIPYESVVIDGDPTISVFSEGSHRIIIKWDFLKTLTCHKDFFQSLIGKQFTISGGSENIASFTVDYIPN